MPGLDLQQCAPFQKNCFILAAEWWVRLHPQKLVFYSVLTYRPRLGASGQVFRFISFLPFFVLWRYQSLCDHFVINSLRCIALRDPFVIFHKISSRHLVIKIVGGCFHDPPTKISFECVYYVITVWEDQTFGSGIFQMEGWSYTRIHENFMLRGRFFENLRYSSTT